MTQKIPPGSLYSIRFVGLKDVKLTEHQEKAMNLALENEACKLQEKIQEPFLLIVHLKEIGKDSKKKEYSVTVKLEYPGTMLSTTHEDWDLETAVRKCFNFNVAKKKEKQVSGMRRLQKG